jgi:DNA-binding beta-propeller fold protein YncE
MKKILPILTIGFILILFSLKIQAQTPTVTILAGSAGFLDSTLAYAQFRGPTDIIFNKKKNEYYVADKNNFRIRVIKGNTVSTLAGNGVSLRST